MFYIGPTEKPFPVCLDCNLKHAQLSAIQCDQLEREMNYAAAHMEAITGMPGTIPRYPPRQVRIVQGGTVTLNNINISQSTIGVLNTGSLQMVDSAITILMGQPETKDIAEAIKSLVNAIASAPELSKEDKNEAIETLSVVASEATAPQDKRKSSVVKRLLAHLPDLIKTSASALTIWDKVGSHILAFFHH